MKLDNIFLGVGVGGGGQRDTVDPLHPVDKWSEATKTFHVTISIFCCFLLSFHPSSLSD